MIATNPIQGIDVEAEARNLRGMPLSALRAKYAEVFGDGTRSGNRDHLVRRILWRLQAMSEGGLSERARRRAMELADDADLRVRPPRLREPATATGVTIVATVGRADPRVPMPGAVLRREYKGRTIVVRVLPRGFEFEGEVFRSLTAVATRITGSHWSGAHFFRLTKESR